MPQKKSGNPGGSGKKKGRAPAHQNKFAFRHNPKSKLTEKILSSPNEGVCRRCYEKIEWRKKYRKYKPRTQPGKCNLCSRRNVKAAYHTICGACAVSEKAYAAADGVSGGKRAAETITVSKENSEESEVEKVAADNCSDHSNEEGKNFSEATPKQPARGTGRQRRVCAVCVKEDAIADDSEANESSLEDQLAGATGRLKLRERRALERKIARMEEERKESGKNGGEADACTGEDGEEEEEESEGAQNTLSDLVVSRDDDDSEGSRDENDIEEDDPFLNAIGGANKLLVGEGYQAELLASEKKVRFSGADDKRKHSSQ